MRTRVLATTALAIVLMASVPLPAHACPVCFGATDSPMAEGVNNGVFVLLGVVGAVQLGLVALFVSVRRRTKSYQDRKDSFEVINGGVR